MTLNSEYERNKDIISKDQHVPELFADDVPCCEHFGFVPEIIEDVDACAKLIGPHSTCYETVFFVLKSQEGKIED